MAVFAYTSNRRGSASTLACCASEAGGVWRMLLGTNAGNARAIGFYRRNGFTEVGSRTFVVGVQHCCDVIFGRDL